MNCQFQQTLINQDGIAAPVTKTFQVNYVNSDVENANSPEAWWVYMGGSITAPGTLDATLKNALAPEAGIAAGDFKVNGGATIADMTQVTAVGTDANDLKFVEVTAGRVIVTVTPSGAVGGKATIALMSNRPFTVTEITP